jgi:hypothetical protein
MTTVFTGDEFLIRLRRRPNSTLPRARPIKQEFGDQPTKLLQVPLVAAEYNLKMGAVDRADQLRSNEGYDHRIRRGGWQALAWTFLLEIALVNSFLLQLRGSPRWARHTTQRQWRQQLVEEIFNTYGTDGTSRQKFRSGDEFTPIEQHKHVYRGKCSRCLGCQGLRIGQTRSRSQRRRQPLGQPDANSLNRKKARMTRMGCDKCDVAICTSGDCWRQYHTQI